MARTCHLLWIGCIVLLGSSSSGPAATGSRSAPSPDAQALAARIDVLLGARLQAEGVPPARIAGDEEIVRRLYLDLSGRAPAVSEVRGFLADTRPDKRRRLVEKLLDNPRYATHFARFWRRLLVPEVDASPQASFFGVGMESWLHHHLSVNTHYDALVRELLALPFTPREMGLAYQGTPTPYGFYQAKELRPENLAASTSRVFLGIKLECAQCHNHPFASWKREQFWSLAAFFAGLQSPRVTQGFTPLLPERLDVHELTIPGTKKVVKAVFLDGSQPRWKEKTSTREALAEWLTAPSNPYFARAAVNRLWAYFFGIGLVDPVDDMAGDETSSRHSELLDELARAFADHHFDLRYLIAAITASQAYQRTSAQDHAGQERPELFARMPLRGLTGEQLLDSIVQATGYPENTGRGQPFFFFGAQGPRQELLARFGNLTDRPTEVQTSILQALAMMNGSLIDQVTHIEKSVLLAAVLDAPFMDTSERIETLFLAALARRPTSREQDRCLSFLARREAVAPPDQKSTRRKEAYADLFWALLNSSEFLFNH